MSSLAELLEKTMLIDNHCKSATSVLDCIKLRRLDVFFQLEEKIETGNTLDK